MPDLAPIHHVTIPVGDVRVSSQWYLRYRAERDCGYCFSGEVPSLAGWHFDEALARRIEQPVHLVAGGDSPPFTHRLVDHLTGLLPGARTTVIPGHNHLLPLTALLADLFRTPAVMA